MMRLNAFRGSGSCNSTKVRQAMQSFKGKPGVKGVSCSNGRMAIETTSEEAAKKLRSENPGTVDGVDIYYRFPR